jgi:hypothetical protein
MAQMCRAEAEQSQMSLANWYFHKADQSQRLAKEALLPHRRLTFDEERKTWIKLANKVVRAEKTDHRAG